MASFAPAAAIRAQRTGSGQRPPPKFNPSRHGVQRQHESQDTEQRGTGGSGSPSRHPAAKSLPSPGDAPGTQHIPGAAGRGAAGPRPARHELASARHQVRKGLTHSLAGCHSAKLLTNSLLTAPAAAQRAPALRLRAASPGGDFPGGPGCDPPCQRLGQARIVRQRVENQTGITGETLLGVSTEPPCQSRLRETGFGRANAAGWGSDAFSWIFLSCCFFFTGSGLQVPGTRQSGESHGPTPALAPGAWGCHRSDGCPADPGTAALAQRAGRDVPVSPGRVVSPRAAQPRAAAPQRPAEPAPRPREPLRPWASTPPLLRDGAPPAPHLKPHVQPAQPSSSPIPADQGALG